VEKNSFGNHYLRLDKKGEKNESRDALEQGGSPKKKNASSQVNMQEKKGKKKSDPAVDPYIGKWLFRCRKGMGGACLVDLKKRNASTIRFRGVAKGGEKGKGMPS